jgi:hypothetical protein
MFYRQDTTVSSLERLGEAGWLPDVRSEESLLYQACNQPPAGALRQEWPSEFLIKYTSHHSPGRKTVVCYLKHVHELF